MTYDIPTPASHISNRKRNKEGAFSMCTLYAITQEIKLLFIHLLLVTHICKPALGVYKLF